MSRFVKSMRRLVVELPLLVWLVVVWCILWQSFAFANILFGLALSLLIVRVFRLPPVVLSGRFSPIRGLAFMGWFVGQIVSGSLQVTWVSWRQGKNVTNAVVEVPLRTRDDLLMTAVGHVASLIPGSLVVDVDRRHGTLYLHVLGIRNTDEANRFRADVLEIERRLIYVMGSREELELLRKEELRVARELVAARREADSWHSVDAAVEAEHAVEAERSEGGSAR